jgi:N-acyl amino acid synthase of PEP-CTERM/exosortase system
MKPSLMRLLGHFGCHFIPYGDIVEYHGLRQPCYLPMAKLMADVEREHPRVWEIVTDYEQVFEEKKQARVA